MSEYWVSQAKHYCKMCNCWMPDNKMSRQHHESSVRHKMNTEKLLKQKRKDALHGARDEKELQQQLAAIEKAALSAVQSDKLVQPSLTSTNPAPRSSGGGGVWRSAEPAPVIKKEENSGIYSIRGKLYLDGRIFEDKLKKGTACEIFIEDIDEWVPGTVIERHETHIPNTSVSIKAFDVEYKITNPDGQELTEMENNVKSDRLRIFASEKGESYQIFSTYVLPPLPVPEEKPVIAENTGVGMWQTVSVKQVDEQKEWEEHEKAVESMRSAQETEIDLPQKKNSSNHNEEEDYANRGKTYKGFVLEDKAAMPKFKDDIDIDQEVTFKKRKLNDFAESKEDDNNAPASSSSAPVIKPKNRNIRKKI